MPVDEFAARLGVPLEVERDYETVAGLVLARLRHLPELGETFESDGLSFEIIDLDAHRVDKILVRRTT